MATKLIKGRVKKPVSLMIYSTAGGGKSTLASGFPSPVFLGPEENDELDVARFPIVKSYNEIITYLNEIIQGLHQKEGFKTLVIDSIDMIEKIIHRDIEKSENKSIVLCRGGFGKAYKESYNKLCIIKEKLEIIRDKCKMNIVILCHCVKNKFVDPLLATEYDTYELPLHKSGKADASEIFVDWVSAVLFLNFKTSKSEDGRFASGTDERVLYTEYRPSHIAKNRFGFPSEIELETTLDARINANKILGMVDEFYSGKRHTNLAMSEKDILTHKVKEMINQVLDADTRIKIVEFVNANLENIEALNNTKVRLEEILTQQKGE